SHCWPWRRSSRWCSASFSSTASRRTTPGFLTERTVAVADKSVRQIAPAKGKLGVLTVGLGAVASTFIAGVENVRRGAARPIGSLTQMGTIRLGKRTDNRTPLINEFVDL